MTAYFDGVITCPTFLVQSVEVTVSGQFSFSRFTLVYTGLHPFAPQCYFACGVYQRAQYPIRHMAARTDSDQVCAVRLDDGKVNEQQNLLSSYLSRNNSLCEECKLILEYDHQF